MPQRHQDRCANTARHDRCHQPPGLVFVRPTGFLAGHAESVANRVPAAPMTASLRHKLSDLTGNDSWVVPCQADSDQVRHVLTNGAGVFEPWFLRCCRGSLGVCGRQRLPGQAFDGVAFALAALRASASSVAVKIVTDSPIKIAPRTRAAVSESPSQRTALASPKTGIRFTIMLAGAARTRAMA